MNIKFRNPNFIPEEAGSRQKAKKKFRQLLSNDVFFNSRPTEKWIALLEKESDLRFHFFPMYMKKLQNKNLISEEDLKGYITMLSGTDKEAWGLVISILRQFKLKKRR